MLLECSENSGVATSALDDVRNPSGIPPRPQARAERFEKIEKPSLASATSNMNGTPPSMAGGPGSLAPPKRGWTVADANKTSGKTRGVLLPVVFVCDARVRLAAPGQTCGTVP